MFWQRRSPRNQRLPPWERQALPKSTGRAVLVRNQAVKRATASAFTTASHALKPADAQAARIAKPTMKM